MGLETVQHDEVATASSNSSVQKEREVLPVAQPAPHAEHGPLIDHKIPQEDAVPLRPELAWPRIRRTLREPFSEFFGVFVWLSFAAPFRYKF